MNVIVQADHIIPEEMAKIQNQVESRTVKTEMITNETTYSITSKISTTKKNWPKLGSKAFSSSHRVRWTPFWASRKMATLRSVSVPVFTPFLMHHGSFHIFLFVGTPPFADCACMEKHSKRAKATNSIRARYFLSFIS